MKTKKIELSSNLLWFPKNGFGYGSGLIPKAEEGVKEIAETSPYPNQKHKYDHHQQSNRHNHSKIDYGQLSLQLLYGSKEIDPNSSIGRCQGCKPQSRLELFQYPKSFITLYFPFIETPKPWLKKTYFSPPQNHGLGRIIYSSVTGLNT